MRVEVEMKNEHLRKLRHSLNMSQSDYGNIVLERDELIKKTHQKEETDAKVWRKALDHTLYITI